MSASPLLDVTWSVRRNRILIVAVSAFFAFIANICGLYSGITVVFSHLLYFPIILAGYWFPRRGIVFSACLAAAYGTTALLLAPADIVTLTAIISRCAIFLVIGTVVSLLSEKLSESEQQMNDIIEFLPDPTFAIDAAGKVIAWNRAIEKMTGIKKADMLGRGNYEYALPFYGKREPVLIDRVLSDDPAPETKYPHAGGENSRLGTDIFIPDFYNGRGAHLKIAATALFDNRGRKVGAIESIRDVTDQVLTDTALQNTSTRLATLAGIIRNDIGKNLAVLYRGLSGAAAYSADPGFGRWISSVRESADGIRQQIGISGAFRDIGTTPPGWIPVQEAVTAAAGRVGFTGIAFRSWTERLELFSDTHLPTAFYHLFGRSAGVKAGATQIVVTYCIRKNNCLIIIEDDGSGFSEEEKERLFGKRDETFGCGLFLAKEILSITSMSLRETGTPGTGARFEILVPPEAYRVSVNRIINPAHPGSEETTGSHPEQSMPEPAGKQAARELNAGEFSLADKAWIGYHDTTGDPGRDRIFAVFVSGSVASLGRCRRHPDGIEVDGIFTLEPYRHRGYSSAVMEALTEACHNDDLSMYAVRELVGLYERFGFVPVTEGDLPLSVQERYRWAAGNMDGADVQPMRRKAGW